MYKNYFLLNRLILELGAVLRGFTIVEIYSQEKDTLIFKLVKNEDVKFLEISTSSSMPFILVKEKMSRAKKNTIGFFDEILPATINDILIAENERIIILMCQTATISFFIRGNNSNIFAESNSGEVYTFRNCDEEFTGNMIEEIHNKDFVNSFYKPDLTVNSDENFELFLKEKFLTISKDIQREARFRIQTTDETEFRQELIKILDEIENGTPGLMINEDTQEMLVTVSTYRSFPYTSIKEFNSLNDAIYYYIGKKYQLEKLVSRKKILDKYFKRELAKLTSKLDALNTRLNTPSREEEYNKLANLLLINIKKLYRGLKTAEIEDIYTDSQKIEIPLDDTISPKENIDKYFHKSKSERLGREKSAILYNAAIKEFERLKNYEARFLSTNKSEDYELIMKELKMENTKDKGERDFEYKFNFKQYLIDKKYNVYVGTSSTNNDLLTTKFAKQNDFWFHARSVPGSHVVLRVENTKEAIPKSVLKAAAALAAYHSKAKTASTAPVTYTLKKNVYKKKGMDAGQVALTKEEVLLVKPEIPSNCEYITGE